jgi:hypothetical protein
MNTQEYLIRRINFGSKCKQDMNNEKRTWIEITVKNHAIKCGKVELTINKRIFLKIFFIAFKLYKNSSSTIETGQNQDYSSTIIKKGHLPVA